MLGARALQKMWSWAKQKLCTEEKIICRLYLLVLSEVTVEAKGSQYKEVRAAYRLKGYVNYQGMKPVPLSLQTQSKSEMCVVTKFKHYPTQLLLSSAIRATKKVQNFAEWIKISLKLQLLMTNPLGLQHQRTTVSHRFYI